MRVQNNITVFTGDTQNNAQADKTKNENNAAQDGRNKTIYAGNFLKGLSLRDSIQQRREQAQERALKIVGDAWNGDREIDKEIDRSKERIKELKESYKELQDMRSAMKPEEEEYKQEQTVFTEDPEEAEFMEKAYIAKMFPWAEVEFTEEEAKRVEEMDVDQVAEYMNNRMEAKTAAWQPAGTGSAKDEISRLMYELGREIQIENAVIRGIRGEKRKNHTMVDAQKQAEDVMAASRDEIMGMVMEDAKEHIDEEQEKKEQEAEAIKEKKEEQEELLEERKEREEEQEELIEDMPIEEAADLKNLQAEIRQEVQNIVNKMHLVAEDIKGAVVDTNL